MDQSRVIGDTVYIKRNGGGLQVQSVMVPLVIADLRPEKRTHTPVSLVQARKRRAAMETAREHSKAQADTFSPAPVSRGT